MGLRNIKSGMCVLFTVWKREFALVAGDAGVLVFFLLLPVFYPLVYTLIYNPEVVRDIPVAVVDDCRSVRSREFVRMADVTDAIGVVGYASSFEEARRWYREKRCYGILVIPRDFDSDIGRGEQATFLFYYDMGLLIRYRTLLSAVTDLALAYGADVRQMMFPVENSTAGVDIDSEMLGDTSQGFASFVIPGILILIIQQSLLLGIAMLGGGSNERRRYNSGVDPLAIDAPPVITVLGKALCYFVLYLPIVVYVLMFVPAFFELPRLGDAMHIILFIIPFLLASIFLGMTLQILVKEREASMLVIVVTSVLFLFLSGLTWPRYAMSPLWLCLGSLAPSTWGINGFVLINSNSATLQQVAIQYVALWGLAVVYFLLAVIVRRWLTKVNMGNT